MNEAAVSIKDTTKFLTDSFGRHHSYLRISVTERCNIRCQYCMPVEGVPLFGKDEILTFEEITRLTTLLALAGVRKVRLTGGEPTVRKNLPDLVALLGSVSGIETVAMTTNGVLLSDQLDALHKNGLSQINISLDTIDRQTFKNLTHRDELDRVLRSIDHALTFPNLLVKINSVVMRGINDLQINSLIDRFKQYPIELRFIEFMPFSGNHWSSDKFVSLDEQLVSVRSQFELTEIGYSESGTSNRYKIKDQNLTIGFISSMSHQFCSSCNRIRLTADGMFKSCLFENSELDLKTPLRNGYSDAEMLSLIHHKILEKREKHAGMDFISEHPGRPMISIGG
jgi:molybdenum cofactor biosynthesis protein A